MIHWAIEPTIGEAFDKFKAAAMAPGAALTAIIEAGRDSRGREKRGQDSPRNYSVVGDVARIDIRGILTSAPDFWAEMFGETNTIYSDIAEGLALAAADPQVRAIDLAIDSPGGTVSGLWETADKIRAAVKPVTARVSGMAASAAYTLASQAGHIVLESRGAQVGSVGVVTSRILDPEVIDITSTEAPNKRPDAGTEEGRAIIRAELDDLHAILAGTIATGRTQALGREVTVDQVNQDYGRGGMMIAGKALAAGMVDEIAPVVPVAGNTLENQGSKQEGEFMQTFEEGVEQGRAQEKGRIMALLALGEKSGAMDVVQTAIKNDQTTADVAGQIVDVMAEKAQAKEIKSEEPPAIPTAVAPDAPVDMAAQVADRLEALMGLSTPA